MFCFIFTCIFCSTATSLNFWLIGCLIDWLFDWLLDWLSEWLLDYGSLIWLIDWLIDWSIVWFDWLVVLIGWLIDWLMMAWLLDCSIDCLIVWVPNRLVDCLTDCLSEWLLAWLTGWLTIDRLWLTDWLMDWWADWLIHWWWLLDLLVASLADPHFAGLTDWLKWLVDVIAWLIYWLIDWLLDWLVGEFIDVRATFDILFGICFADLALVFCFVAFACLENKKDTTRFFFEIKRHTHIVFLK